MSESAQGSGRRPAYDPRVVPPVRVGWTRLREIGNSPVVRLTIAIPLVGYVIIFNESLLHYLDLSRELFGGHSDVAGAVARVSWRLLLLYFGLCFVAAGAALYGWYCPGEIKSYRLASDYVASVLANLGGIGIGRIEAALENGSDLAKRGLQDWRKLQSSRPIPETDEQFATRRTEGNRGLLELHFDSLNRSHPIARVACAICYAIGITALFIPSFDVFLRVVIVLVRQLLS
jgi:hypothetical protein